MRKTLPSLISLALSLYVSTVWGRPSNYKVLDTASISHREDGSTSVYVRATFDAPLAEILAIVDPQNWDECSAVFKKTFVVTPGTYDAQIPAPKPGSAWEGELYEEVSIAGLSNIRNVLWFKGEAAPSPVLAFEWTYGLKESLSTTLAGKSFPGGVFIDDGRIRIEALGPNRWLLDGVKRIGFRLPDRKLTTLLNKTNPSTYRAFLTLLMHEFGNCDLRRKQN